MVIQLMYTPTTTVFIDPNPFILKYIQKLRTFLITFTFQDFTLYFIRHKDNVVCIRPNGG